MFNYCTLELDFGIVDKEALVDAVRVSLSPFLNTENIAYIEILPGSVLVRAAFTALVAARAAQFSVTGGLLAVHFGDAVLFAEESMDSLGASDDSSKSFDSGTYLLFYIVIGVLGMVATTAVAVACARRSRRPSAIDTTNTPNAEFRQVYTNPAYMPRHGNAPSEEGSATPAQRWFDAHVESTA